MEINGLGSGRGDRGVRIILDTNMLLLIAEGLNVLEMIEERLDTKPEYIVLQPVIDELEKIMERGRPSMRRKARLALEIALRKCRIIRYNYDRGKRVDDLIVEYAYKNGLPVATNDKELRKKLRRLGIPEIYLRGRKKIEVSGLEY